MALQIVTQPSKFDGWPANRPTELVIAERVLAVALYDYHIAATKPHATFEDFRTWEQLTDTQKAFLVDYAVPAAVQAIWQGKG